MHVTTVPLFSDYRPGPLSQTNYKPKYLAYWLCPRCYARSKAKDALTMKDGTTFVTTAMCYGCYYMNDDIGNIIKKNIK